MRFLKFPTMVGWSVTGRCNLSCTYCSQGAGRPVPGELGPDEALALVDVIARYRASVIGFTGGEPFTRPDLERIVNRAVRLGLRCVVTTNGLAVAAVDRSFLVKFVKIRVSLDAPVPEVHEAVRGRSGAFAASVEAIRRVRRLGIKVEVVSTVGRHNVELIEAMHDYVEGLGVPEWSVSILLPAGRGADKRELCFTPAEYRDVVGRLFALKRRSRLHVKTDIPQHILTRTELGTETGVTPRHAGRSDHFCSAGTDLMVIFPDGSVGPCFSLPLTAGNVRTQDLYDIWNNAPLFQAFRDKSRLDGNCAGCEFKAQCGGCRAFAHAMTGDFLHGDPLCWHRPLGVGCAT